MRASSLTSIALLATSAVAVDDLRRIVFDSPRPLVTTRLDPNVNPGMVSQHEHRIVGGNNFEATYNSTKLRESSCSTMAPQADKSNYWHPSIYKVVYNETTNTTQYAALWGQTRIYYNFPNVHNGTGPGSYIEAFPDDFQLVVGNAGKKTGGGYSQDDLSIFYYWEQDFQNGTIASGTTYSLPDFGATFLVSKIWFPSCWDGVADFPPLQTSQHVQYPLIGGGLLGADCPTGFEHRIPSILVETFHFGPGDFPDGPAGPWGSNGPDVPTFILANGDTTGYGLHADFANGWNTTVLEQVVTECLNGDFDLNAGATCHPLNSTWSYDIANACRLSTESKVPAEHVGWDSYLDALPGCNLPWGAEGPKPTCPGFQDPEIVPWSRFVGIENNEEASLADIAAYGPTYANVTSASSSSLATSTAKSTSTAGQSSTKQATSMISSSAAESSTATGAATTTASTIVVASSATTKAISSSSSSSPSSASASSKPISTASPTSSVQTTTSQASASSVTSSATNPKISSSSSIASSSKASTSSISATSSPVPATTSSKPATSSAAASGSSSSVKPVSSSFVSSVASSTHAASTSSHTSTATLALSRGRATSSSTSHSSSTSRSSSTIHSSSSASQSTQPTLALQRGGREAAVAHAVASPSAGPHLALARGGRSH